MSPFERKHLNALYSGGLIFDTNLKEMSLDYERNTYPAVNLIWC